MKIRLFFKQLASYSTIGFVSLVIDASVYIILSDIFIVSKSLSKIISFIIASVNSFLGNKIFTFRLKSFNYKEPIKFILLYSVSLIANSSTHDFFLKIFDGFLPFVISTIVSVIINFTGQKLWVFKNKNN
ncbi:GtrA family protein [Flavobacteriaceae bacterium]|nr:GtrA family protein [Flavobacteriaceae bacterium]